MRSFSLSIIIIFIVFASSHTSVIASECPIVEVPEQINEDTRNCLTQLDASFPSYSPETNLESERNFIIMRNSRAEQPIVIGVFYVRFCELLNETRWNLTPDAKQHHLELAQQKLFHEVPFGPPVIDSRTLTQFQPGPQMQFVTGIGYDDVQFQHANLSYTDEGIGGQLVDNHIDTVDTPSDYLRKTPYVVTDANKDFVMISSVRSEEDAIKEVKRLKRKAPQFDFIAYGPYRGNPNFAIMMATWVPNSVAQAALKDAREYVSRGSMIWSCRERGSYC